MEITKKIEVTIVINDRYKEACCNTCKHLDYPHMQFCSLYKCYVGTGIRCEQCKKDFK